MQSTDEKKVRAAFDVLSQCKMLATLLEDFLGKYQAEPLYVN